MAPREIPYELSHSWALTADSRGLLNPPETTTNGADHPIRFSEEGAVPGGTKQSGRGEAAAGIDVMEILASSNRSTRLMRLFKPAAETFSVSACMYQMVRITILVQSWGVCRLILDVVRLVGYDFPHYEELCGQASFVFHALFGHVAFLDLIRVHFLEEAGVVLRNNIKYVEHQRQAGTIDEAITGRTEGSYPVQTCIGIDAVVLAQTCNGDGDSNDNDAEEAKAE